MTPAYIGGAGYDEDRPNIGLGVNQQLVADENLYENTQQRDGRSSSQKGNQTDTFPL